MARSEHFDTLEQAKALLTKAVAGFQTDPGTSDLDDEQPIHVRMTLGDYRAMERFLWRNK